MKYFKKLVGERIYLSTRSTDDAEVYTKWMNDFEVTDYTGRSATILTLDAEKKYLENKNMDLDTTAFAIVDLKTDKMVGTLSLENVNYNHRTAVLGIFIGDPDYRSNGYGTEAIKLLLDYGFNYMNLNTINLSVLACNERAIKCYKKCGFKEAGVLRKSKYVNGKYYDTILMDILAEEFTEDCIKNKNVK